MFISHRKATSKVLALARKNKAFSCFCPAFNTSCCITRQSWTVMNTSYGTVWSNQVLPSNSSCLHFYAYLITGGLLQVPVYWNHVILGEIQFSLKARSCLLLKEHHKLIQKQFSDERKISQYILFPVKLMAVWILICGFWFLPWFSLRMDVPG